MKHPWHPDLKISKWHFTVQLVAAVAYVLLVLVTLDIISSSPIMWAVGSSSLASSAYLIFASPSSQAAAARRLVGSYAIAIVCGIIIRHFATWLMAEHGVMLLGLTHDPHMYWLSGAVSVGVSMFVMLLFRLQHPPAAGMALVMVIDQRSYEGILAIFFLAVLLAIIKIVLRRYLCDVTD